MEVGKLHKLWQLELYNNELTGKHPVELRNLTKLELFDASANNLEGDIAVVGSVTMVLFTVVVVARLTGGWL
ncbi:hypothetical protein F3Y22_tig00110944pilonHSYRG00168 [Hibiscus syriacus]|uniref:Uncharacterized protein n=2 Tax=Hibiscus syriacus TaxID=106335 RepID=A0A6A2ZC79_HIBSY|nr:hypothetical protein F3Y22_tig00110944pilonHSYRG00168 [Hibiscus syriacus]